MWSPDRCVSWKRPFCVPFVRSLLDAGDLEHRQSLTVTLALVIAGLVLELVDADLGTLGLLQHLEGDSDLLQVLGGAGDVRAVDDEGNGQRDLGARLTFEFLNLDHVTDSDFVLLAAGLDDCVRRHRSSALWARATGWCACGSGCGAAVGPLSSTSAERQLVKST